MYVKKIMLLKQQHDMVVINENFYTQCCKFNNPFCGDSGYIYLSPEKKIVLKGKGCVLFQSSCQLINNCIENNFSFKEKSNKKEEKTNIVFFVENVIKDIENIFKRKYDNILFEELLLYENINNCKRFDCIVLPWIHLLNYLNV